VQRSTGSSFVNELWGYWTTSDTFANVLVGAFAEPDNTDFQSAPVYEYQYDKVGNLRFEIDPLGRVTEYEYDNRDRLVKAIYPDPDGAEGPLPASATRYIYNPAGELKEVRELANASDETGPTTYYDYDELGRLKKTTLPDPDPTDLEAAPFYSYTYDAAGNLLTETDPLGQMTRHAYDGHNNRIQTTLPAPNGTDPENSPDTEREYDDVGRLVWEEDGLDHRTIYLYDALDNLISETDANNQSTALTYDEMGNRLSLTDPAGNKTEWYYDDLHRVKEERQVGNPDNPSRFFQYDAAGNLVKRTDRNGRVTEYEYDQLHRLKAERWKDTANGPAIRSLYFTYDAADRMISAADPAAAYIYKYDDLDRIAAVTHDLAGLSFNVEMASSYNADGDRSQLKATIGSTADFVNDYVYDDLHRLTQVTQQGAGGNAVADKRVDFAYDKASQWSTITRYEKDSGLWEQVALSTFAFDDAGRLTGLRHENGGTTFADYAWTYDRANRVTAFANVNHPDDDTTYAYDETNQLIGADRSDPADDESYSYDANGNRLNYTTGVHNRLESDGVYDYEYDAEGNRTKRIKLVAGSPTGETTEYEWDHRNRLTKITERSSSTGPITKTSTYAYDVFGRRVSKGVDADGAGPGAATPTYFIYDGERADRGNTGDQIVLVLNGQGAVTNRYLYGPAVDQILADEQVTNVSSPGNVLWPLADNLGTVRDLADYNAANNATTIANHREYDSFGNIKSETNAAVDHFFAFTGREFDEESGLQQHRERPYDPLTSQFLSEDPIYDDYNNSRRYAGNSPTNATDPSGLEEASIGAAPPWYQRLGQRVRSGEPLIADPRDTGTHDMTYWVFGNLYHRTPLGELLAYGLRSGADPIGEPCRQLANARTFLVNIPNLPQAWNALPQYKREDIGINTLMGVALAKLPYGEMATISRLQMRTMSRQQWKAFYQQQRAYQSGLQQVSRWGQPGLKNEAWVMYGGQTCRNYVLSGKWQPGFGNRFAPFGSGQSYFVPYEHVVWPSGWGMDGRWKGFFGQRIYIGPNIK
jgi:RHS repeat-associated protein